MDEAGWMLLVALPLVLGGLLGLIFRRAWQRIAVAGVAAASMYAFVFHLTQLDMVRRGPIAGSMPADAFRTALEVGLVTLPIGLCTGAAFHLITRLIRTRQA
ncbi:hypothetical protein [Luteimonas kalidii]|uniref:Uncharacterized protein n=1 Tax=Luteimonas kalidii TaxID=3042025 RepID=A0ABT6JSD4_9GAMM|nr:hypothetical protein [Luteimonas kalidii]MDH5833603.1 hypothetical protein [Luteimonas kalidii]